MVQIFSGIVYKLKRKEKGEFLILYNISSSHLLGFPVYVDSSENTMFLESINRYVKIEEFQDISKNSIGSIIYVRGKPLSITHNDIYTLNKKTKSMLLNKISYNIDYRKPEDLNLLKWLCKLAYLHKNIERPSETYRQNQVVWVDFGFGVGSELRKLRPAILLRASGDKKMWTMIPLSTKGQSDDYYFHYDLAFPENCTAKVECMENFSIDRILAPYYRHNKLIYINTEDLENIKMIIKRYYTFEQVANNALETQKEEVYN